MNHNAVLKFTALDFEAEAFEKDKASAQNEIDKCDLLIKRYKDKADELAKDRELSKKQSELTGDVDAINIIKNRDAFEIKMSFATTTNGTTAYVTLPI
jgi:hypothetical protein